MADREPAKCCLADPSSIIRTSAAAGSTTEPVTWKVNGLSLLSLFAIETGPPNEPALVAFSVIAKVVEALGPSDVVARFCASEKPAGKFAGSMGDRLSAALPWLVIV